MHELQKNPGARLAILGASGRVGRLLAGGAQPWPGGLEVILSGRTSGDLAGDLLAGGPPHPGPGPLAVVSLAGGPHAGGQAARLARAAADWAARAGALRLFYVSSQAVYRPGRDADENAPLVTAGYGGAKAAAEAALGDAPLPVTILRLGNVAGADSLGRVLRGETATARIDRFPDGHGPLRSYVGPRTLRAALAALAQRAFEGTALPVLLNLAQPGAIDMADLAAAAGARVARRTAPADALPRAVIDLRRMEVVLPLPAATPAGLVAEVWSCLR